MTLAHESSTGRTATEILNGESREAVRYRVGSSGELRPIPDEGLDPELWYALRTISGVEWYGADGHRCNSPPPSSLWEE